MQSAAQIKQAGQTPPVLHALRVATEQAHRRLEARHLLGKHDFSRADYENILRASYGFYLPLEQRLTSFAAEIPHLHWHDRRKLPLLWRDLNHFGHDAAIIERLPRCGRLPDIGSETDALGCLYVLEGATLGGQVLLKRVRHQLNIDAARGAAFFAGYGERTGAMWRRFIDCLHFVKLPADIARACASAQSTFQTFEIWLDQCGALSPDEEMHD